MTRITGSVKPTNKDGEAVDITARSEGNPNAFQIIDPGFYNAVVSSLGFGTYQAAFKGFPNPDQKDGKWTYGKLTPTLSLLNENHTQISKQDVILGVLVNNSPFQPRGNDESPIWKEAQYLLSALGLFTTDGDGVFSLDFDPDLIHDRVVRVGIGTGGYVKSGELRGNFKPAQLRVLLQSVNGDMPYEDSQIAALVNMWNLEYGLTNEQDEEIEEGVSLRLKNYVTNFYGVNRSEAEKNGWFYDEATKAVFLSESAYHDYNAAKDTVVGASEEKAW